MPITQLHPLLRGLLFTDGTVSRLLEAITLSRIAVEPLEQAPGAAPAGFARHLEIAAGAECLRRRVIMRVSDGRPIVWAESCFVTERLPPEFLSSLDGNAQGIGGSLRAAAAGEQARAAVVRARPGADVVGRRRSRHRHARRAPIAY